MNKFFRELRLVGYGKVIKFHNALVLFGEAIVVFAYVMFKVSSGTEREVCQKIVAFDEVMQADVVFGEYDVIAKISAQNLDALEDFLSQKLRSVPGVILTSTMIIGREYKGKNKRPKNK